MIFSLLFCLISGYQNAHKTKKASRLGRFYISILNLKLQFTLQFYKIHTTS